jgi:hypothetical protein
VQFPPNNVQICLTINSNTQVKISQGCRLDAEDCDLYFPPSVAADSWGKRCRLVSWSRQVPTGAYIRIQLCPLDGCTDACNPPAYGSLTIPNSLSTFTVNGVSKTTDLLAARQAGGEAAGSCLVKAACIGAITDDTYVTEPSCCLWTNASGTSPATRVSWTSLGDLPVGTELVYGPIGL